MLHMLLWLYTHISSICFKCFICFRRILQVFHVDVSKVDLGEHMFYRNHPAADAVARGARGSPCGYLRPADASASGASDWDPCESLGMGGGHGMAARARDRCGRSMRMWGHLR
jgi:hypothetical protein